MKHIKKALKEEERCIQELRCLVDRTAIKLKQGSLTYEESRNLIEQTRMNALELFPDKGDLFDLVHRSRFYRILDENFYNGVGR